MVIVGGGGASQYQMLTSTQGGCLRGDVPPSEARKLGILKLESCNLVNTFGNKFEAANG